MNTETLVDNPFSLMLNPAQVIKSMKSSESLRRLSHHKFSPLDKPMIPLRTAEQARQAAQCAAQAASGQVQAPPSRLSVQALRRQVGHSLLN